MLEESADSSFVDACGRTVLAASEVALVEECTCGAIYVSLGAVTLRFTVEGAVELARLLTEGMQTRVIRRIHRVPRELS